MTTSLFDINTNKTDKKIFYNYPETHIGSIEKTINNNGYLKFPINISVSNGFSYPNLLLENLEPSMDNDLLYIIDSIFIFNKFYNIKDISYDGLLIVEHKPINSNLKPKFVIFLLKTNKFIPYENEIDKLINNKPLNTIHLNKYIRNEQKCIVFKNIIIFTEPIIIKSTIGNEFITPKDTSIGILNLSYNPNYKIYTSQFVDGQITGKLLDTIKEGFDDTEPETCRASDINGNDISEIALVPVDSDYLNGVYQITILRTLFDMFLFFIFCLVCYFISPKIYKSVITEFIFKFIHHYSEEPQLNDNTINAYSIFIAFLFILIGLYLSIDGVNRLNGVEMVGGIYFTILIIFSIISIIYTGSYVPLKNNNINVKDFINMLNFSIKMYTGNNNYKILFFSIVTVIIILSLLTAYKITDGSIFILMIPFIIILTHLLIYIKFHNKPI